MDGINTPAQPATNPEPTSPVAATAPTETEIAIAQAIETKDAKALADLSSSLYTELKSVRSESAGRKDELRELKDKVAQFEQTQEQARLAKMSEIERLKEEKRLLQEEMTRERTRSELAFAENAFIQAGAHDSKSLLLHYKELPAEQRSKLDPKTWAEEQKSILPHLFKQMSEPAPITPAAPVVPQVLANTGRPNNPTIEPNRTATNLGRGSSEADRNRAWAAVAQGHNIV